MRNRSPTSPTNWTPRCFRRTVSPSRFATGATPSPLADGLDRTLVLGGGGTYYLAWYCGFFHGLFEQGIDAPSLADMIVGTSAGSYAGSSMASGHFQRMRAAFDFFGYFPGLFARAAPVSEANASQQRAQKINAAATDGSLATRRMIGHAALAADNHVNGAAARAPGGVPHRRQQDELAGGEDAHDGRRLLHRRAHCRLPGGAEKNGIPLAHAAAASSSLPGIIGPTLLGQRYCMDGGMCSNPAHVDLVAGSKRALIVTLNDGLKPPFLTGIPHPIAENIRQAEATGTKTLWIKADPPNVNLLDPQQILPAIRTGYDRAKQEADGIKAFWAYATRRRSSATRDGRAARWFSRRHRVRYHVTKRVSRPNGGTQGARHVPTALLEDALGVAQRLEAFDAVVGAHAARADTAERQIVLRVVQQRVVDRHVAGRRALQHLAAVLAVAAEIVECQRPRSGIDVRDGVVDVPVGHDRQYGSEDLLVAERPYRRSHREPRSAPAYAGGLAQLPGWRRPRSRVRPWHAPRRAARAAGRSAAR